MLPGLRIWGACRALALRARPPALRLRPEAYRPARGALRLYSDERSGGHAGQPVDAPDARPNPTSAQAGGDVQGATADPEQGSRDQQLDAPANETTQASYLDAMDDATLENFLYSGRPPRDGPLTPAQEESLYNEGTIPAPTEAEPNDSGEQALEAASLAVDEMPDGGLEGPGHKFGLPQPPYPADFHLKRRCHPVIDQVTRLIMKHGKLSTAQRNMAMVMNFLRTAPAPIYSPKVPLLPGTPPASHLPLNPTLYITIAIDSLAPLIKVKKIAGAAGGGRALDMPKPLNLRQRRRTAFQWILGVVAKKPSRGSGRKQFPHRIAEEIIAVVEGRSSAWERRRLVHKLGTMARANVGARPRGKRAVK